MSTGTEGGARAWDGVVEAVREAALSAQTSGRVAEVPHDVNDRVAAGDPVIDLHLDDPTRLPAALEALAEAVTITDEAPAPRRMVHERITRDDLGGGPA